MMLTDWDSATLEQRDAWVNQCRAGGHDFYYIDGSLYQWDCARCNWSERRTKPSLPLNPSMPHPRFQIIDTWRTR